jgi:hypothetical protein
MASSLIDVKAAESHTAGLAPPIRLETGSIVSLRMRGHSRTGGLDYYAPAVVLNQHQPNGELEVLVWDSTAGAHFNPNYPVRDLGTRGDGSEREMYVLQENVQQVLFSPELFAETIGKLDELYHRVTFLSTQIAAMQKQLADGPAHNAKVPASASAPSGADKK